MSKAFLIVHRDPGVEEEKRKNKPFLTVSDVSGERNGIDSPEDFRASELVKSDIITLEL